MGEILTITAHDRSYRIVDPGGRIGSKLVNGEPYERKLLDDVYRRGVDGRVAFDVGAHVGNHSLYFGAVCEMTVFAFEPHPVSFPMLVENVELNPGLDVRPTQVAIGAEEGRAEFASHMQLKLGRGHIPVRRLDDIVGPVDVAVVKVDVEGMEAQALDGALNHLRRCRPALYVETHTRTAHKHVAAVIEPLGYRVVRTIPMGSVMEVWEA